MKSNNDNSASVLPTLVFLIFLTLKLAGIGQVATWSWWWVTSPLWLPLALILVICALIAVAIVSWWIIAAIGYLISKPFNK